MSLEEEFLRDIRSHPDDDEVRLIYADWLTDQGDPRGEFIRVQVDLAARPLKRPRRAEIFRRERELLTQHQERWLEPIRSWLEPGFPVKMKRGFLSQVRLIRDLPDQAVATLAASPWLALLPILLDRDSRCRNLSAVRVAVAIDPALYPVFLGSPAYRTLPGIAELLRLPLLEQVEVLDWGRYSSGDRDLAILAGSPYTRNLRVLRLPYLATREVWRGLFQSPNFPALTELDIHAGGWLAMRDLSLSTTLSSLEILTVRFNPYDGTGPIGESPLQPLFHTPNFPNLSVLRLHALSEAYLSDTADLPGSPMLARLRTLELHGHFTLHLHSAILALCRSERARDCAGWCSMCPVHCRGTPPRSWPRLSSWPGWTTWRSMPTSATEPCNCCSNASVSASMLTPVEEQVRLWCRAGCPP